MPVPKRAQVRDWLEEVAAATAKATLRVVKTRSPGRTVKMGASGSPTSHMDAVAEKEIIQRLPDAPIPLNLVTEEFGVIDNKAEWSLLSDPVDGSRNALHDLPFHCVSLAVGRKDLAGVEMGLIWSIPTPEVYYAEKGKGATLDGHRLRPRRFDAEEILIGTALDYEEGLKLPGGANVHFRDLGSAALEMCLVARGSLDGFLASQPLVRIIDIAASTLVVREAGGHVFDLNKKPLNVGYDLRHRFSMMALGDLRVWGALHG